MTNNVSSSSRAPAFSQPTLKGQFAYYSFEISDKPWNNKCTNTQNILVDECYLLFEE